MTHSQSVVRRIPSVVSTLLVGLFSATASAQTAQQLQAGENTYSPVVPTKTFEQIFQEDSAAKNQVLNAQKALLESRYDLRNDPSNVQMSGNRKADAARRAREAARRRHVGQSGRHDSRADQKPESVPARLSPAAACEASDGRHGVSEAADRRHSKSRSPRHTALRRRLRSARSSHARVSAADVPHLAARFRRRDARRSPHDQELLPLAVWQGDARANGGYATAVDAVSATAVQSDRRPQSEGGDAGRFLPRLPHERSHERHVSPESRYASAGQPVPY